MSIGLAYWIVFLIVVIWFGVETYKTRGWSPVIIGLLILAFLGGWGQFGPPIR